MARDVDRGAGGTSGPAGESLRREQEAGRTAGSGQGDSTPRVAAWALLPMRLFLGVTFVYAGLDKILDPAFFNAADPASIQAQLVEFARVSPIAPLVQLAEPFAVPVGILVALAEVAIGLGALTGLAYRLAAAGGAALALTFWLTASWTTSPYYFGPDLPYAVGWLTLALAGHAGLLVPRFVLDLGRARPGPARRGWVPGAPPARLERRAPTGEGAILARRTVVQAGVLGISAFALAAAATPFRLLRGSSASAATTRGQVAQAGPTPSPAGTAPAATADTAPAATAGPAGSSLQIARISDVTASAALPFTVPFDAPAPLPAGDPAVIVQLASGEFVAYDAVCTHEGCTVEWAGQEDILFCPCHGAAFDGAHGGQVLQGPARRALAPLPLVVDQAAGTISLQA